MPSGENFIKHGMSDHPLASIWHSMRQRCNDPKCAPYQYYGARGISVCTRWDWFPNFVECHIDASTKEIPMTTPKDEFEAMGAVDASRFDPALFNILQQVVTQRLHDIPVEMALYTLAVAVGGMQFMSPGRPEDAQKTVDDGMRHGDSSAKDARERKSTVPS